MLRKIEFPVELCYLLIQILHGLCACHMTENNNLIEIIPFIYYLLLKFAPELLLSTPIGS